jgi:O-antigen/teichoic acid export membrane protein
VRTAVAAPPGAGGHGAADEVERLDRAAVRSWVWVGLGFGGKQLLAFVTLVVLARLVDPRAFGLVALASIVLQVLSKLQGAGLWASLVYRRHELERAASSALVAIPAISVAVYAACFALAPLYARAVGEPALTDVLRVLGVFLVIQSFGIVPSALIERAVNYRARLVVDIAGGVTQLAVAVTLAALGFGVWSLVAGVIAAAAVETPLLWLFAPFRPSPRQASWRTLRELSRYGRPVAGARMANVVTGLLDTTLVGRLLGATSAGFYAVGLRVASFPNTVVGYIVGRAMFPVYSSAEGHLDTLRVLYVRQLQRVTLLAVPLSVAVALLAEPLVIGLLGERWREAIGPVRLLAIAGMLAAYATPCAALWRGLGRPQLELRFAVAHLAVLAPALVGFTSWWGVTGAASAVVLAWGLVGSVAIGLTLRLLGVAPGELLRALAPALLPSVALAVALAAALRAAGSFEPVIVLFLLAATGAVAYAGAAAVFARGVVAPMWASFRRTRT